MKVLIIAAHADDEVLGCGGTILNHTREGDEVYVCILTKAYAPDWTEEFIRERSEEIQKSNKILGVKKTFFLDLKTGQLDLVPQKELNDKLTNVVREAKPEVVYIPHKGDLHKDHRLVFYASLVATRPGYGASVKKVLSYETLSETDWGNAIHPFSPNVYVGITDSISGKIKAMEAYKSEVRRYPHSRSLEMIKILAQKRGSEANLDFAEAFLLIRENYGK